MRESKPKKFDLQEKTYLKLQMNFFKKTASCLLEISYFLSVKIVSYCKTNKVNINSLVKNLKTVFNFLQNNKIHLYKIIEMINEKETILNDKKYNMNPSRFKSM